jgi:hypothetical protein
MKDATDVGEVVVAESRVTLTESPRINDELRSCEEDIVSVRFMSAKGSNVMCLCRKGLRNKRSKRLIIPGCVASSSILSEVGRRMRCPGSRSTEAVCRSESVQSRSRLIATTATQRSTRVQRCQAPTQNFEAPTQVVCQFRSNSKVKYSGGRLQDRLEGGGLPGGTENAVFDLPRTQEVIHGVLRGEGRL